MNQITAKELAVKLKNGEKLSLIDVREVEELAESKIEGVVHIPLGQLSERLSEISKDDHHYLICHAGGRSARGCDILSKHGYKITNVSGGMVEWEDNIIK